jgi:uncharacterized protein YbcI
VRHLPGPSTSSEFTVPGFEFRYRLSGEEPTIRSFVFKNTETLTRGDMLNLEDGQVDLGVAGDTALLGACLETLDGEAATTYVRMVTDADAVYAVHDPNARRERDHLDVTGLTGAQGVVTGADSEFTVVIGSTAEEQTLVTISVGSHHAVLEDEGRRRPVGGELNAAITRAVVRYYRAHVGRGPKKAQTFYRRNVIVVVLEEMMTKAEQTLIARGKHDAVAQIRDAFQETMRDDLIASVEDLTGAKVRAFMGGNSIDPDMSVEVFILDRPVWGEPA